MLSSISNRKNEKNKARISLGTAIVLILIMATFIAIVWSIGWLALKKEPIKNEKCEVKVIELDIKNNLTCYDKEHKYALIVVNRSQTLEELEGIVVEMRGEEVSKKIKIKNGTMQGVYMYIEGEWSKNLKLPNKGESKIYAISADFNVTEIELGAVIKNKDKYIECEIVKTKLGNCGLSILGPNKETQKFEQQNNSEQEINSRGSSESIAVGNTDSRRSETSLETQANTTNASTQVAKNNANITQTQNNNDNIDMYSFRVPIYINNPGNVITDYQIIVNVNTATLILQGKMRSDCGDIRFTDSDGVTQLNYWLESGCNSPSTKIWIKVPYIPESSTKTVYMYYGNPTAASKSALWYNLNSLGINNGVFNYDSFNMQHRLGIAVGWYHTCILKVDGNVGCYGSNSTSYGWHYYGQANNYTGGDAIGVAAGREQTCVLKANGDVDCYGRNTSIYSDTVTWGQASDYTGGDAIAVSSGEFHTCILKANGNVECYGWNSYGQANNYTGGDAIGVAAGTFRTCILKANGNVECYGWNSYGQANNYTGGDAIGVSAGTRNACILKANGDVECYGWDNYGQPTHYSYTGGDAIGVSVGYGHSCILKANGNVECYGWNSYGQANNYTGGDAIGVAAGQVHTCILKANGDVECYGYNNRQQVINYSLGDALNPFRKYANPEPTISIGIEEQQR